MTTEKSISWTTGNGRNAIVSLRLRLDGGYAEITAFGGVGFANAMFDVCDSALSASHPAAAVGASNGCGDLVWTAERNAEILAAYNELAAHPAYIASEARKAANLASSAADSINGDINRLTRRA